MTHVIRAKLAWGRGPNSNEWGWIVQGQPNFDPTDSGNVAAHDLLEHMRPTRGATPIANELQALGVLMWGRGLAGSFPDPAYSLAMEIEYHGYDIWYQLDRPPRVVPRLRDERLEEWIAHAMKETQTFLIRELTDEVWDLERRRELRQKLEWTAMWLRIGVQRARRRYPTLGPGQFTSLFHNVGAAVGPLLDKDGEEGDYISVLIRPRERTATARVVRRYDF